MKAIIHRASNNPRGQNEKTIEVNTLEDLLHIIDETKCQIILDRRNSADKKDAIDIQIYDDFIE